MTFPIFSAVPTVVPDIPYASFWRRLASNLLDSALLWGTVISWFIPIGPFGALVFAFPLWIFKAVFYAITKTSLGRIATKTRVYDLETGGITSVSRIGLRGIAHIADAASIVGWFLPLRDARRQTFADKVMNTVVLRVDKLAEQQSVVGEAQAVVDSAALPQAS